MAEARDASRALSPPLDFPLTRRGGFGGSVEPGFVCTW